MSAPAVADVCENCSWGKLFSRSVHCWPAAALGADEPAASPDSGSPFRGSSLGVGTVGVEVDSGTLGVGGAVMSECGVDGALVDSTSSSFFFFLVLFFFPFSSGMISEYS